MGADGGLRREGGVMEAGVCFCDYSDVEEFQFCVQTIRRARKEHRCYECGEAIPVGAQYEECRALFDGDISTMRTCLPCSRIRRDYGCGLYGGLAETVWDLLGIDIVTGRTMEDPDDQEEEEGSESDNGRYKARAVSLWACRDGPRDDCCTTRRRAAREAE